MLQIEIKGTGRCSDVKRDAVVFREHRERVGADFICRVSIRRNPICPGNDSLNSAFLHHLSGH